MSRPKRIQRRRTKGWRMPEGAIYVGRSSRWGNPFKVVPMDGGYIVENVSTGKIITPVALAQKDAASGLATMLFERYLRQMDPDELEALITPLRGHDVTCWCGLDEPCHADSLLELANAEEEGGGR